jgi:hypothetical protein
MAVGASGISVGLLLFGPKLIRMVGNQITKLNPMRAYCVALSAASHRDHRLLARPAGELHPHRRRRGLQSVGFLPRMVHRKIEPQG